MAKTLEEIRTALALPYAGTTKQSNNYDYVPWPEALKIADTIFDPDGYDIEILKQEYVEAEGTNGILQKGYSAIMRVTIHPSDGRPFFRDGLGYSELVISRSGVPLVDSAIKGVMSRCLCRALVLLGWPFGLELYMKKEDMQSLTGATDVEYERTRRPQDAQTSNIRPFVPPTTNAAPRPAYAGTDGQRAPVYVASAGGKPVFPKQKASLEKFEYPAEFYDDPELSSLVASNAMKAIIEEHLTPDQHLRRIGFYERAQPAAANGLPY